MEYTCDECGMELTMGEDWPFCPHGKLGPYWTGDSQLHDTDKVVIEHNPRTGVTHIPGRVDKPMHPKKVADGFERRTLNTCADIKQFEKQSGKVSEALNYHKNNGV